MLERFVLPSDIVLIPVAGSSAARRAVPDAAADDWILTRPGTRLTSRIVGPDTAALLHHFRTPRSVVEALMAFAADRDADPGEELEQAYPMLRELVASAFLVPEDSPNAAPIAASVRPGETVAGFRIGRCLHMKQDIETYQAWDREGTPLAIKLARAGDAASTKQLAHEAAIIARVDGGPAPRLLADGVHEGRRYLAVSWCAGVPVSQAAAETRTPDGTAGSHSRLRRLCLSVLRAYARLHRRGVVHGDIHPHNILVDQDGRIALIDFGLARNLGDVATEAPVARGGVSLFYEPEVARADLEGDSLPPPTQHGEQYALAVLVFGLMTGADYIALPAGRLEAMRQIAEAPPRRFVDCGAAPWPGVEAVLDRALAKRSEARYPSVAAFAEALADAPAMPVGSRRRRTGPSAVGALLRSITDRLGPGGELDRAGGPPSPSASVYYGAAGTALGLLRLAQARDDAELLAMAQFWAMQSRAASARPGAFRASEFRLTARRVHGASPYHGIAGVHVVRALLAQAGGRPDQLDTAVRDFLSVAPDSDGGPSKLDLTLGAPGILIACALLHDALAPLSSRVDPDGRLLAAVEACGDGVDRALWQRLSKADPGHARVAGGLSGIAHGWSGLAYALMLWRSLRGTPLPDALRTKLDRLAARAEPFGRGVVWPIRLARGGDGGTMPSWCNGAPGQTHLWLLAHRRYGGGRYLDLAERCAWNAWEAGHGTGCLCCGEAGRAYAVAAYWRETGDDVWLKRARALAERAATRIAAHTARPDSLFKGALGPAVVVAELDRPQTASFPFFERTR